jgi:hypothetical protein
VVHPNARLSPEGRWRLVRLVVEDGWSVARAAERFQVSDRLVGGEPGAQRHGGRVNLNWPRSDELSWPRLPRTCGACSGSQGDSLA